MANKISKYLLILGLIFFIGFLVKGHYEGVDFRKNLKIGIGKYTARRNYPKTSANFFVYYIKGKKYRHNVRRMPIEFYSNNLGKFYRIKYSEKYVDMIIVLFDQEVTDTVAILEAGFSVKDIKNIRQE